MMRKTTALILCWALLHAAAAAPAAAAPQVDREAERLASVKRKVLRAGVGEKARVSVKFKDGRQLKGYVAESREDDFVLRDDKTDAPTTIAFSDVSKVEIRRPPATQAQKTMDIIMLGVGVSALVFLAYALSHTTD